MKDKLTEWLDELSKFTSGQKDWDTSCIWVCESHPIRPWTDSGHELACDCGAPGMPPIVEEAEN